jgi:3-deoxy-manno-octulosonate cytidylyltransferase (CMP-KDO synthetase)
MIIALIPARYDSSRLPGKPLLKFGDKTMIQMVYEKTCKSVYVDKTYVVTDDERVKDSVELIGGNVIIVKEECVNGTERLCKAIMNNLELFEDVNTIVNVQGDEPFIKPNHIDIAISNLNSKVVCSTLHYKITDEKDLFNRSIGKLILDNKQNIIYCSRNCIPYNKEGIPNLEKTNYYGHIGIFVFNKKYLLDYYCKENTPLQLEEDIEWLKIIEQGFSLKSTIVKDYEIGVNLPEDYTYLLDKYKPKYSQYMYANI